MTRSSVKVTSPLELEIWPFSKAISSAIYKLATDHGFLNYSTISKFYQARFLIFGLVFVLRDFEVATNVSCEESTVIPCTGLIFHMDICQ